MRWQLFLLLLISIRLQAQPDGFSRVYKAGMFGCTFPAVEPCGTGYMVAAYGLDSTNPVSTGVKFLRFDAEGNLQAGGFFTLGDSLWVAHSDKALVRLSPNRYALVANVQSLNTAYRSYLVIIADSNGQIVRHKRLPMTICVSSNFMTIRDIAYDPASSSILAFGHVKCATHYYQWMMMKLDTLLEVRWSKSYGQPGYVNVAQGVLYEEDGYTMYGMVMNSDHPNSKSLMNRSMIIKTDTAGNELWTYRSPTGQLNGCIQDLLRTPDGGYAYICTGDAVNLAPPQAPVASWAGRGTLVKLDATRQKEWQANYPGHRGVYGAFGKAKKMLLTADQKILIAGPWSDSVGLNQYDFYAGVRKYELSGQLLWEHKYKATDTLAWDMEAYSFNDACLLPDGGFLFAGTFINETFGPNSDEGVHGWLVRTDSNGCRYPNDPACKGTAVEEVPKRVKTVTVYPNPAQGMVTVAAEGQFYFVVINTRGERIYQNGPVSGKATIDTQGWSDGLYLVIVRTADGQRLSERLTLQR